MLAHAGTLVWMRLKGELANAIKFVNEWGLVIGYPVEFEWKPLSCLKCKINNHLEENCKKNSEMRV